jgi:hypothetical protein
MDHDFPAAHSMDALWFAVDATGHVAMFSSGENGHVPKGAYDESLGGDLWRALRPGQSDDDYYDLYDDQRAAQLGLFFFDYADSFLPISCYLRSEPPATPLHVDELPPEYRRRIKQIRFTKVDFSATPALQPVEFFPCDYWYAGNRIAYLCGDGKTVRPVPGHEAQFLEFRDEFRRDFPDEARNLHFEGLDG